MIESRFNEGKACDAVIRRLEAREGSLRQRVQSPEREGHIAPIEITCLLNGHLFAVEHTGIEPFAGHIKSALDSSAFFQPIKDRLFSLLPKSEEYELHVPVEVTRGLKKRAIQPIQEALVRWIQSVAPTLPVNPPGRLISSQKQVLPPGVPFIASLYRFSPPISSGGQLWIVHLLVDEKLQEARRNRLAEACTRKFPKLNIWKQNYGARSVLILENNDAQLTNQWIVAEVILDIVKATVNRPDEIYFVTTCRDPWWVSPILIDDTSIFDLDEPNQWAWATDPKLLTSLTCR